MIIVQLKGGLGNQMFQYSIGRVLSIKNNDKLYLDTWFYKQLCSQDTARNYELGVYSLPAKSLSPVAGTMINYYMAATRWVNSHPSFLRISLPSNYIIEESYKFDNYYLSLKGNIYLSGYWQCERYFSDYRSTIIEDFTSRSGQISKANRMFARDIKASDSVSIHVRRTDYVTNPNANSFHGLCSLDYYKRAMSYIEKIIKSPTYFVFSDDPSWVRDNIKSKHKIFYITHNKGANSHEDIRLMSLCKHNIIANSSFSWWGAWLNTNKNKVVISPKKWFNSPMISANSLLPKEWIKL